MTLSRFRETLARVKVLDPPGEQPPAVRAYLAFHADRYRRTIAAIEALVGKPERPLDALEIGPCAPFATVLASRVPLHLRGVSGSYEFERRPAQVTENPVVTELDGRRFEFRNTHGVNVELDPLPFPDASFDLVLFLEVIEHLIRDPVHALREIARVLRPGGRLVLTTDNASNLIKVMKLLLLEPIYFPYAAREFGERHNREFLAREVEDVLRGIGFAGVRVTTFNHLPFLPRDSKKKFLGYALANALTSVPPFTRYRRHVLAVATKGEALDYRPSWLFAPTLEG